MAENKVIGRKSIKLPCDLIHVVEKLSNKEAGLLIDHILRYAFEGGNPEHENKFVNVAFIPVKQYIDEQTKNHGSTHWNWKGGVTTENKRIRNSPQIKEWRLDVFTRDRYTCQGCGQKGGVLHAHHIKPFATHPESRFEVSNGTTLCKNCHHSIHSKGM